MTSTDFYFDIQTILPSYAILSTASTSVRSIELQMLHSTPPPCVTHRVHCEACCCCGFRGVDGPTIFAPTSFILNYTSQKISVPDLRGVAPETADPGARAAFSHAPLCVRGSRSARGTTSVQKRYLGHAIVDVAARLLLPTTRSAESQLARSNV